MSSPSSGNGNFEPYVINVNGLAASCAWYVYTGSSLSLQDYPYLLTQALVPTEWQIVSNDTTELPANIGDYLLVNIFPADNSVPNDCGMRLTTVFGRGHDHAHDATPQRQSPLQITQGSRSSARPVVDSEASTPSAWPISPSKNNVWTFCLGALHPNSHNTQARYSMSVGATVWNPSTQQVGIYGDDPTMKVGGKGDCLEVEPAA
ncbi:MAG TPA: hypothetical protein VLK33_15405 [Terriglobales bacterium]|nr:hypothetical protein [Terriglobales bacterium]